MALTDVDTRALTRHLRKFGAMRGIISTQNLNVAALQKRAIATPTTSEIDLVAQVTCTAPYEWTEPVAKDWQLSPSTRPDGNPLFVVAYDFGLKRNILRQLVAGGCRVRVVPAGTPAAEVLALRPDGVFLSNGPGDPQSIPYVVENVRLLLGQVPLFGICLGHQVLALALGAKTYKLKFGHHGNNHPVKDLRTGKIAITAQNHNFAILAQDEIEVTHLNLYDQTIEGLRHSRLRAFSVQYHPEAAPGPHDANPLFAQFTRLMEGDHA